MVLWPSAKEAIAMARIVCDLEAGISTLPASLDFRTISFIAVIVCAPSALCTADSTFTRSNKELKEVFD
jgi:hypothetical protein